MHTKSDFVRAICECPANDHLRLVYADWLEENGEGERANYIRQNIPDTQQTHHNYHWDSPQWHPAFLKDELEWLSELRGPMGYHKGFCRVIWLPADYFIVDCADLFRQFPLEEVHLTDRQTKWISFWDGGAVTETPTDENIPTPIFDLLWDRPEGHKDYSGSGKRLVNYTTNEGMDRLLSECCVEYGRQKAGLPPLRPQAVANVL